MNLRDLAQHTLEQLLGSDAQVVRVVIVAQDGRRVSVTLGEGRPRESGAVPRPVAPVGQEFSPAEEAVLEVLGNHAGLVGPQIATLAGYPYDSRFRAILAGLRRRGAVVNHAPGYALA